MKLLNITVRNIVGLIVIIALAAVMIQLVRGQTRSPQTAQAGPTETASLVTPSVTNTPTATSQSTSVPIDLESPSLPTIVASPIVTEPYPIFDVTVIPGPTYTPIPPVVQAASFPSAVTIVEDQMLPLNQLRPLSSLSDEEIPTYALFNAVGWTENGEVVFQERQSIERGGTYLPETLYRTTGTWSISPETGESTSLANWTPFGPAVVEGFMDSVTQGQMWVIHGFNNEGLSAIDWATVPNWTPTQQQLANEWSGKISISFSQHWYASPDKETILLRIVTQKIYLFKQNWSEPVILPEGDGKVITPLQISTDGQYVVYGIQIASSESQSENGSSTDIYEMQVSDMNGDNIFTIRLNDYGYNKPGNFTWSTDGRFIAFTVMTPCCPSESHIFVVKSDGTAITTDITPREFQVDLSLYWSPQELKLLRYGGDPSNPETIGYRITTFTE